MITSLIALLPKIVFALFFCGGSWVVLKLWYSSRYVHRSEVKPLQESQHMMQNQYAILAERIKHTETLLNETRNKLETAILEREQALLQLKEYESSHAAAVGSSEMDTWKAALLAELKATMAEAQAITSNEKSFGNEQLNYLRQTLKEFKLEFIQKFNTSTNQYNELSNQLRQLIELNKNTEEDQITRVMGKQEEIVDENIVAERQFTLASIKKRS